MSQREIKGQEDQNEKLGNVIKINTNKAHTFSLLAHTLVCEAASVHASERTFIFDVCVCVLLPSSLTAAYRMSDRCTAPSMDLFKEHTAPQLHVNAIIILVFSFADSTLTFTAFLSLFFLQRGGWLGGGG